MEEGIRWQKIAMEEGIKRDMMARICLGRGDKMTDVNYKG